MPIVQNLTTPSLSECDTADTYSEVNLTNNIRVDNQVRESSTSNDDSTETQNIEIESTNGEEKHATQDAVF